MGALGAAGIATSVHFQPLHRFSWFAGNAIVGPGGVTNAERIADRVVSLPLSPALRDDEVDRVCDVLIAAVTR
jgi:dTDP-4-amino-4,6-dideoxygalactose transaminase